MKKKALKKAGKKRAKKASPKKKIAKKAAKKSKALTAIEINKALKKAAKKTGSKGAPGVIILGEGQAPEPVWFQFAQAAPAKHSNRPSVPTDIKVGNLVGWSTDGGKNRIGVVGEFMADSAVVGIGGKNEVIRISRLIKLADKMKEK